MRTSHAALRIALLYLLFAALWIALSDRVLMWFVSDPSLLTRLQTSKGLAFVAVTTLLLYLVLRHEFVVRQRAEERVRDQVGMLEMLYAGAQDLSRTLDVRALGENITRTCVERFGARIAWLGRADADGEVRPVAYFPPDNIYVQSLKVRWDDTPPGQGPTGRAIRSGRLETTTDIAADPRMAPWRDAAQAEGIRASVAFPLIGRDETFGAFSAYSDRPDFFTSERLEFIQAYAHLAGAAMENAMLYAQVRHHAEELEQRVADRTTALQSSNEALEAFAYSVSHDLRAPLRAVQGMADALREDYAERLDDTGQDYLRRLGGAAARMDGLIQDLLAYGRLSRAELKPEVVNLASVVAEAQEQMQGEIERSRAEVTVDDALPTVTGHRATLLQAVSNLLSNAVKFAKADTPARIRVRCESREGRVRLWVEDNGIGIDPEYHERIFRVFERLHGVESYPGTGIGLAIVHKGMERLGGQAGVESKPGEGSRFWIELPAG